MMVNKMPESWLPKIPTFALVFSFSQSLALAPFNMGVFVFILFFVLFLPTLLADNYTVTNSNHIINNGNDNVTESNPSSSPSPSLQHMYNTPFKPTIAVIVALVLTTMFSITFLLLLYAKHCGTRNNNNNNSGLTIPYNNASGRNSGINRAVVESLPLFRFSSLIIGPQKDGLDCAVCLTRFQPNELLRLLPKCKHAFHVDCVDTWLEAHSTCPLCRYRVHPEDILLINQHLNTQSSIRRVSGRHSHSAGETSCSKPKTTSWFRRSLDSSAASPSLPSASASNCRRKDGLLLLNEDEKKRLEHRIIVSGSGNGAGGGESGTSRNESTHQRWSDVQPSDLLYLRSEMIIKMGIGGGPLENNGNGESIGIGIDGGCGIGRSTINSRSVSEITGLSRFSSKVSSNNNNENDNTRRGGVGHARAAAAAGLVSRWLAWISPTLHSDVVPSQPV